MAGVVGGAVDVGGDGRGAVVVGAVVAIVVLVGTVVEAVVVVGATMEGDGAIVGSAVVGGAVVGGAVLVGATAAVSLDPDPPTTTPAAINATAPTTRPTPSTRSVDRGPPGAGMLTRYRSRDDVPRGPSAGWPAADAGA